MNNYKIGQNINDCKIIELRLTNKLSDSKLIVQCLKCGRVREVGIRKIEKGSAKTTFHKYCSFQLPNFEKEFFSSWANMCTRTSNPNYIKAKNYSERGIINEDFKLFVDFYDLMYESYKNHINIHGIKNTTLERLDVNKGYSKNNCTWATWHEQANNKTSNLEIEVITPNGKILHIHNLKRFCELEKIDYNNVSVNLCKRKKDKNYGYYTNRKSKYKFKV